MSLEPSAFEMRCTKCGASIVVPSEATDIICPVCMNEGYFVFFDKTSYIYWAEENLCEISGMILPEEYRLTKDCDEYQNKSFLSKIKNLFEPLMIKFFGPVEKTIFEILEKAHPDEFIVIAGPVMTENRFTFSPKKHEEIVKSLLFKCDNNLGNITNIPNREIRPYLELEITEEDEDNTDIENPDDECKHYDSNNESKANFEDFVSLVDEFEFDEDFLKASEPRVRRMKLSLAQKVLDRYLEFFHVHPSIFYITKNYADFYYGNIPGFYGTGQNFQMAYNEIYNFIKPQNIWYLLDKKSEIIGKYNVSPLREDAIEIEIE